MRQRVIFNREPAEEESSEGDWLQLGGMTKKDEEAQNEAFLLAIFPDWQSGF